MTLRLGLLFFCIPALMPPPLANSSNSFSQENSYVLLRTLVHDIGPRPMGSPAERAALEFAAAKFKEYGCQQAYVMPMTTAAGVNTNSGIAVGRLQGKTGRIIVIGGHIDSAGPDIPGANDDGSGAACVMELARVLGRQEHESTLLFCCWGGEEHGLRGSIYFVDHYPELDSIALMLQIDMADGAGVLELDPDSPTASAPQWLVKETFDVADSLGFRDLIYPTHSATLNAATGGQTGSDHIPFLDHGIPAIDFTSDVDYPIHTPQDNLANFTPSGLKRSGDIVQALVDRFDAGIPSRETDRYKLVVLGLMPMFFPHWLIWVYLGTAVALSLIALFRMHRRRIKADPVKWSWLKLLLVAFVIQLFLWLSVDCIGLISGYRAPWVNNFEGFVGFALLSGLIGLWFGLQMLRSLRISMDPYRIAFPGFVLLYVFAIAFSVLHPHLAGYAASSLMFFSLAMLARSPHLKVVFWLLSPYPLLRLIFFEDLGLIQRALSIAAIEKGVLYEAVFIFPFFWLSLPFVYGFAALYRETKADLLWLRKFRTPAGLALTGALAIALGAVLLTRDVYDRQWFNRVSVQQRFVLGADSSSFTIQGSEYLDGIRMTMFGRDSVFRGRDAFLKLDPPPPTMVSWFAVDAFDTQPDSLQAPRADRMHFTRTLLIHSQLRPMMITVTYTSDDPFDVTSSWAIRTNDERTKSLEWYSFPDSNLVIPIAFTCTAGQRLEESIEAIYDTLAYPMHFDRELTNFRTRTIVSKNDTVRTAGITGFAEMIR